MSWGYIPKKLKRQRRQSLLRKKYKNFSCDTCRLTDICCSLEKFRNGRVEFCPSWKKTQKANNVGSSSAKKKGFFKTLFK